MMDELESQDLAQWLDTRFLGSYAPTLQSNGYTAVADIAACTDEELASIIRLFKKPGHRLKARILLDDLRAAAHGHNTTLNTAIALSNSLKDNKSSKLYHDADEDEENQKNSNQDATIDEDTEYQPPTKASLATEQEDDAPNADIPSPNLSGSASRIQVELVDSVEDLGQPKEIPRQSIAPDMEPDSEPEDGKEVDWEPEDLIVVPQTKQKLPVSIKGGAEVLPDEDEKDQELFQQNDEEDEIIDTIGNREIASNPEMKSEAVGVGDVVNDADDEEPVEIVVAPPKKEDQDDIVVPVKPFKSLAGTKPKVPPKVIELEKNQSSSSIAPPIANDINSSGQLPKKLDMDAIKSRFGPGPPPAVPSKPEKPKIGRIAVPTNIQMPIGMIGKMPSPQHARPSGTTNASGNTADDPDADDSEPAIDSGAIKLVKGSHVPIFPISRSTMATKPMVENIEEIKEFLPCDDEDASVLKKIDVKNIKTVVKDGTVDFEWAKNGNPIGSKKSVFIVLDDTALYWFKSKNDINPLGKISLARYQLSTDAPDDEDFLKILAGVDCFSLTFRDNDERNEWAKAIKMTKIRIHIGQPIANPSNDVVNPQSSGASQTKSSSKEVKTPKQSSPKQVSRDNDGSGDEDEDLGMQGAEQDELSSPQSGALTQREVEKLLIDGQVFMKYKHGRPKKRYIWAPPEMDQLYWGGSNDRSKAKGCIRIRDIAEVVEGCKGAKTPNFAFTITTADRSLELEAPNPQVKNLWMEAVRFILNNRLKKK